MARFIAIRSYTAPRCLTRICDVSLTRISGSRGRLAGVEGYVESAACGLVAALLIDDVYNNRIPNLPPETTALSSLIRHLSVQRSDFQPTNVTYALFPPLEASKVRLKRAERCGAMAERALDSLRTWWSLRIGCTPASSNELGDGAIRQEPSCKRDM